MYIPHRCLSFPPSLVYQLSETHLFSLQSFSQCQAVWLLLFHFLSHNQDLQPAILITLMALYSLIQFYELSVKYAFYFCQYV